MPPPFTPSPAENAAGKLILADSQSDTTVIEWGTAPMNLTSFELSLASATGGRELSRMQLAAWGGPRSTRNRIAACRSPSVERSLSYLDRLAAESEAPPRR